MYIVKQIERKDCTRFVIEIHYAHRWPSVSYAYGLFLDDILVGVVTYGSPVSYALCKGVCGDKYRKSVIELNRLVLKNNEMNEASLLIGRSLRLLAMIKDYIVVSYADTMHDHIGYVYQATNFLFTGTTKARTDIATINGKHARHGFGDKTKRMYRSAKHRYIVFIGSRRFKKQARIALKYPVLQYPKER